MDDFHASQKATLAVTTLPQFKRVDGREGKVESICMNCLLAVGICCSDEELLARESMHRCNGRAAEVRHPPQIGKSSLSLMVWT